MSAVRKDLYWIVRKKWPTDIEQQEGRILRQGNLNPKVKIFRYVTEGTFDSYSWQFIENKQKFIGQIMTSKSPVRSCEDIDDARVIIGVRYGYVCIARSWLLWNVGWKFKADCKENTTGIEKAYSLCMYAACLCILVNI